MDIIYNDYTRSCSVSCFLANVINSVFGPKKSQLIYFTAVHYAITTVLQAFLDGGFIYTSLCDDQIVSKGLDRDTSRKIQSECITSNNIPQEPRQSASLGASFLNTKKNVALSRMKLH